MEFQKFWKYKNKMCECFYYRLVPCGNCPIYTKVFERTDDYQNFSSHTCAMFINQEPQKAELIIEEWAEKNPMSTNSDKLKEIFGEADISLGSVCGMNCVTVNGYILDDWLSMEYEKPIKE